MTAKEDFDRWFCAQHRLTQMPKPEHRLDQYKDIPTMMESAADTAWNIWKAGWDARGSR